MPETQVYDTGDAVVVKKRKKKVDITRERELSEVRELIKTKWGRGFLHRLLVQCHTSRSISHHDSQQMAILSGQRDIGLWIQREIETADPHGYVKLLQENLDRELEGTV